MLRKGQSTNAVIMGASCLLIAFGLVILLKATSDYFLQDPLFILESVIGAVLLVFGTAGLIFAGR